MADNLYRFRRISRYATDLGEGGVWFGFGLICLILSFIYFKKSQEIRIRLRHFVYQLYASLIISGITLHLLKYLIGRARPHLNDNHESLIFQPLTLNSHYHSMPSGHSQVLFAAAASACIFLNSKWHKWIYTLAFLLSFTRVIVTQHFLSDVIIGCLLGYWGAFIVRELIYTYRTRAPDLDE